MKIEGFTTKAIRRFNQYQEEQHCKLCSNHIVKSLSNGVLLLTLVGLANLSNSANAQLATNASSRSQATLSSVADEYLLGAGDRIHVDVFGVADYTGDYQVLSDGSISMPLVGVVPVQGLTLLQASNDISRRYARFLRVPSITVRLVSARPIKVAISGEVYRPGVYSPGDTSSSTLSAGPSATPSASASGSGSVPTLTSLIQMAGGITQSADIRKIRIERTQNLAFGTSKRIEVNLWQLLQSSDLSQDITLRDGDRIVIPTATALDPAEANKMASASFSPTTITVNVVGEVQHPGAVQVQPNTPLNQALLAAGGFNTRAKRDAVEFVRLNPNGTVSRREVAIDFTQGVNEAKNPPLRNYDTIVVSRSGVSKLTDAISPILSPLTGILGVLKIFGF